MIWIKFEVSSFLHLAADVFQTDVIFSIFFTFYLTKHKVGNLVPTSRVQAVFKFWITMSFFTKRRELDMPDFHISWKKFMNQYLQIFWLKIVSML